MKVQAEGTDVCPQSDSEGARGGGSSKLQAADLIFMDGYFGQLALYELLSVTIVSFCCVTICAEGLMLGSSDTSEFGKGSKFSDFFNFCCL